VLTPTGQKQLQALAFKQVLPRQQPLSNLFEGLVAARAPAGDKSLPADLGQEIQTLLARLPNVDSPEFRQQFKEALLHSGIFAEAHLVRGGTSASDLKSTLLKLLALTQSMQRQGEAVKGEPGAGQRPPSEFGSEAQALKPLLDLSRQLESALARIQLNQLCSVPQEDQARQVWHMELPVRQGEQVDVLRLAVKREGSRSRDGDVSSWSLTLRMGLKPLGPMCVQLRLYENRISAVVWSKSAATTQLVSGRLTALHDAFERAGLVVERIAAVTGEAEVENLLPSDLSLLDEMA
jgi:hypothetical protein